MEDKIVLKKQRNWCNLHVQIYYQRKNVRDTNPFYCDVQCTRKIQPTDMLFEKIALPMFDVSNYNNTE